MIAKRILSSLLTGTSVFAVSGILAVTPLHAQDGDVPEEPGTNTPPDTGAVDTEGQAAEDSDEVILVTGLRASMASAQSIKVNSDQFVDSITAIDIGALPDRNVAEALQRISGIQIERNRGEGSGIAIRGLTQVRTEVNGRDSFGAFNGRALGFEDVPSELLAGVDVYKNPSAELVEGAIGGLVNLRTRVPFDQDGLLLAGSVGVNNYSLSDTEKFNASGLISYSAETDGGRFGILFNASYYESNYRSDELVLEPFVETSNLPDGIAGPQIVSDGAGIATFFGERERRGLYGALQWAPSDDLEFYAQVFNTKYTFGNNNYSFFVTRGTDPQGVEGLTPVGEFEFAPDGTFLRGGYSVGFTSSNNEYAYNETETTDYAAGFNWSVNDRLKINADLQFIEASAVREAYAAFGGRDAGTYYIDLTGDTPLITFGPDGVADTSNYYVIAVQDHIEDNEADQWSARVDLEWEFDYDSPLRSFTAGARYTDRSAITRSTPYNWTFVSAPWGGGPLVPFENYAIDNPNTGGPFFGGRIDVQQLPSFDYNLLRDPQSLFSEIYAIAGANCCNGGATRDLVSIVPERDTNTQTQKTYAAYGMLRFGRDEALSGNVGLRVVRTKNTADGFLNLTYRETPSGPNLLTQTTIASDREYTSWLPSLNLRWRVAPDLQFRAAASKGLSRPPFFDLRAMFALSENYQQDIDDNGTPDDPSDDIPGTPELQSRTGGGGNPFLEPLRVNQADFAVEWFPNSQTLVYGTVFYKDLTNFLTQDTYPFEYEVPGQGVQTFTVSSNVNGTEGTIKGFEIGGNTFFDFLPEPFDGLGLQANLTYVDSSAPGATGTLFDGTPVPNKLQGLSDWSYNIVGLYEKGPVHARIAYNWRDDYLLTIASNGTGNIPIYREAYGQIDASFSYDFGDHVSVVLDVVNLTNSRKDEYQYFPNNPRKFQLDDRRIGFSIRFRN